MMLIFTNTNESNVIIDLFTELNRRKGDAKEFVLQAEINLVRPKIPSNQL